MSLAMAVASATVMSSASMVTPAMTTVFTPAPTTCLQNQLTMLENQDYEIWMNYPLPVPGTTFSDCYPTQFMSSFLASASGTTAAPAFSPLVCPAGYTTVATSWVAAPDYIACCPSSYGLAPNDTAPSTRPAWNGKCYTNLNSGATLQMTLYGTSSLSNTNAFTVSTTGMQAYAIPYEGIAAAKVAPVSVPATPTSSSSVPPATYTVFANANTFIPNTVNAHIDDTIIFEFQGGNHSVTQSSFNDPCEPLPQGIDSGYMPNLNNVVPYPSYTLHVSSTDPQWFYSRGKGDCAKGMTFGLNPNSSETEASFQGAAMSQKNSSGGTSRGVKIGVSVGVIVGALLIAALLGLFLMSRRRRARAAAAAAAGSSAPAYDNPPPATYYPYGYQTPEAERPPVPEKPYVQRQELDSETPQYELPDSPPAELAGSRFSQPTTKLLRD